MGAVFSAQHVNGQKMSMDYLPKESAQALYRIAQEREEQARLHRQQLHIDQARAGAMQINVGMPQHQATPATTNGAGDVMQRMATLKMMFDQGMITQADFDSRKKEILASV